MKRSNHLKGPKTEREWALYRAKLNCQLGRKALDGQTQPANGYTAIEYALFCILHSLEDMAEAMKGDRHD